MRYLILFLASFNASAQWCDVKDKASGAVLYTYEGACNQKSFGGPWGDQAQTVHVVNTTKQKQLDDAKSADDAKKTKKDQRLKRIETQCANAEGLVKDLCDHVLDN